MVKQLVQTGSAGLQLFLFTREPVDIDGKQEGEQIIAH